MARDRSRDWLAQAEDDLRWAHDTLAARRFSQACFVAQQVCEKALKALAIARGFDQIRSHSILEIAEHLGLDGEIESAARRLDQYYITARYPDALPAGAPFQFFTEEQAREAVELAARLVTRIRAEFERA